MAIDPTRSSELGPRATPPAGSGVGERSSDAPAPPRGDTVEISEEARALAESSTSDRVPLTDARLSEIHDRLESGYYRRAEVAREIAQRILDKGDV